MNNALELISAYNTIDAKLRNLYHGKGNLQFSDLVRRCAEINKTVKRYEEELMSLARLRNAIVHNSTKEMVIAEPCDEFTELAVRIAQLLSAPPKLKILKEKSIKGISESDSVQDAIRFCTRESYSNIPVYNKERFVGMLNNRRIVRSLGRALEDGEPLEEFLVRPCSDILREDDFPRYYQLLGRENTVQEAIDAFEANRKLLAVVVTEHGRMGEPVVNILTASDLPKLIQILED